MKIKFFIIILILLGSLFSYSYFIGTTGLITKEYKVINNEVPNSFSGVKIVHFSDLHFNEKRNQLNKISEEIKLIEPEIIFFTGDLIDKDAVLTAGDIVILKNFLKELDAPLGKYFISGNHDYAYSDYLSLMEECKFINLNNDIRTVYNGSNESILLLGLDSELQGNPDFEEVKNKIELLKENPSYSIMLLHEPDYIDDIDYKSLDIDLILAGHSHNGQVRIPLIGALLLPENAQTYYENYYDLNSSEMYISSGLGTSILNVRFLNKPSINFYRLSNK